MFRVFILSLIILGVSSLKAEVNDSEISHVSKDNECLNALIAIKEIKQFGRIILDDDEVEVFTFFWSRNSVNQDALRSLSNKVLTIKNLNNGRMNMYEEYLMNAIFSFMSEMKDQIEGNNIGSDVLPNYIKNVIHLFNKISPVQMFIYTHVINNAVQQLKYNNTIDFSEPIKSIRLSDLEIALKSSEQRKYVFQKYNSLLQNNSHQIVKKTSQIQGQEDEKWMINQGYNTDIVAGLDHANDNLKLAQYLREGSMNISSSHIPEFANLIDEHINFIRKGITESREFSESDKIKRLGLLDELQLKAKFYKDSKKVTYLWWLSFNLHLSIIATSTYDLINDDDNADLDLFIFQNSSKYNRDIDSFKEWMINDDGLDLLKILNVLSLFEEFWSYRHHNYDNSNAINNMVKKLGLDLTVDNIRQLDAELKNDILLINELASRLNVELSLTPRDFGNDFLDPDSFYKTNALGQFIYLISQFPKRIMIPTIHNLGTISINRTYGMGVHLIGLVNQPTEADAETMSSFAFFLHDLDHSSTMDIDDPQVFIDIQNKLERFPIWERELIEEWYFEHTHERKRKIDINDSDKNDSLFLSDHYSEDLLEVDIKQEKNRQVFLDLIQKIDLTNLEKKEFQKTILMLIYLELVDSGHKMYEILNLEENIEFTEENIKHTDVFMMRFISKLYELL